MEWEEGREDSEVGAKTMGKRNTTIDYLKAIACFAVVSQHGLGWLVNKACVGYTSIEALYVFSSMINVPLFFIVSGFLLYKQPVKAYLCKKIPKIMIPFITFTCLKLIYSILRDEYAHGDSLADQLYKAFVGGELYWFSYSIMLMFLLAPLFWNVKRIMWKGQEYEIPVSALVLFGAIFIFNIVNSMHRLFVLPGAFNVDRTVKYLPFFLAGFLIKYTGSLWTGKGRLIPWILLLISIPYSYLYYMGNREAWGYLGSFLLSALLCMDIWVLVKPIKRIPGTIKCVSSYTYQIFFLDSFIKVFYYTIVARLLGSGIYQTLGMCLLIVFIEVLTDVGGSCILCMLAEHVPVVNFLFGLSDICKKKKER